MKQCPKCSVDHNLPGKFCSRKCANSRTSSAETRAKQSAALIGRPVQSACKRFVDRVNFQYQCRGCGEDIIAELTQKAIDTKRYVKTCSPACATKVMSDSGKLSASTQASQRRSQNEILFSDLCASKYEVKCNTPMFEGWDADVILVNERVAILWNGKWHYEKITAAHSVEQVQNRDRLKIAAIERCGFIPYVIKDLGRFDPTFVEVRFGELVNWLSRGPHKAE